MWFKSNVTIPAVAAISFCLIGGTVPALADILHVPGDFPTIQEAIDAAEDGDEVVVAPGTYFETINLLSKAITVRSSGGPELTTIDGTGFFHVVQCVSGEGLDTVLDGFTITGGNADGDDTPDRSGGGMYNLASSPTVANCVFEANIAGVGGPEVTVGRGGGMYNENSSPTVTCCVFEANIATGTGRPGGFGGEGGGMYNKNSSPTVTYCLFQTNAASDSGFDGHSIGGGMFNRDSSPTVNNCRFDGNSADFGGGMNSFGGSPTVTNCVFDENIGFSAAGGMYNYDNSPTVTDCSFDGNTAGQNGGGMFNDVSSPTVTNCIFSSNFAIGGGGFGAGAMFNFCSSPTVANCTFSRNVGDSGGAMLNFCLGGDPSFPTLSNCVLWDNIPDQIVDLPGSAATLHYSNIMGGWSGLGSNNIDADPMFVDPGSGNYHLSSGSPCIDAGNNWGVPIDENDYDEDGLLCELFPVDLDGNPRFNADEADFDPGCGVPVVVDMGAYEYQFDPVENVIFADLNADGAVGAADLLGLLASWGSCGKGCCLADLDIDGSVGASDLLALLAHWGPCP